MRIITTILLLITLQCSGTVYYVDNAGNDANSGTSTGSPWRTIAKVSATSFSPGDQILFKRGGVWNESLTILSSGSAGNPITYSAYGTGVKPIITGLQSLAMTQSGNIWSATATNSVKNLNLVVIDGSVAIKARYPNNGYLTLSSYSGDSSITGSLSGTPNYTGAEAVVRSAHWIIDVTKITAQSGGTLSLFPKLTYPPQYGTNGYYIQNVESALDLNNEWYYDSASKLLKIYHDTDQIAPAVQISTIDTLVKCRNKNNIVFDGLAFTGANKVQLNIDSSHHITLANCLIRYAGSQGIIGSMCHNMSITNDSLVDILSTGMYYGPTNPSPYVAGNDDWIVTGNYFKNIGRLQGMGSSGNAQYMGLYLVGQNNVITHNSMDSVGYIGIYFNGQNTLVAYNYVTNFCLHKDDGGGIYTFLGGYFDLNYDSGSIVRKNIVRFGWGDPNGTTGPQPAAGIYLDNNTNYLTVDSNTVQNSQHAALFLNDGCHDLQIRENTLINDAEGSSFRVDGHLAGVVTIKHNIFYSSASGSSYVSYYQYPDSVESIDSNYYMRPLNTADMFYMAPYTNMDLSTWKSNTGYDVHANSVPSVITSTTPLVLVNPTSGPINILLNGDYYDTKNRLYINRITLQPFQSAIMFEAIVSHSYKILKHKYNLKTL